MRLSQLAVALAQLFRLDWALAAVADVWLMVFLAYYLEPSQFQNPILAQWPLPLTMLVTAVVAMGMHGYGSAINDLLDARHDKLFQPDRPLPSGKLSMQTALAAGICSLMVALFAAIFLGRLSSVLSFLLALGILFYNTTAKHLPAVGIITLALLRAVLMFIPNPLIGFTWPIWLALTHVTITAALAYRLRGRRPRLSGADLFGLCAGWVFWTMSLLGWMALRHTLLAPNPVMWIGPLIAVGIFVLMSMASLRLGTDNTSRARRTAGSRFQQLAIWWLIIYDAGWLLTAGCLWQAAICLVLLGVCAALGQHFMLQSQRDTATVQPQAQ